MEARRRRRALCRHGNGAPSSEREGPAYRRVDRVTEWLLLLAAVLLTALTGCFVAAEFSLTTVDRTSAVQAAEQAITFLKALHRALDALDDEALAAAQSRHDALAAQKLVQKVLLSSMIGDES